MENKVKNIYLIIEIKLLLIILIFFNQISLTTQQEYIRSSVLQSGKILIINEYGILIYDQNLELSKQIVTYSKIIQNTQELQYIDITQFSDNENFLILCRIKTNIYLISDKINEENKLLYNITSDYNMDLSLIPYEYYDSKYLLFICYINNQVLTLNKISIINNNTEYFLEKKIQLTDKTYPSNSYHTCELMYSTFINSNVISCFHVMTSKPYSLIVSTFTPNNLTKISNLSNQKIDNVGFGLIKSTLNKNKTKILICFANGITNCTVFDIDKNKFSKVFHVFDNCIASLQSLNTQFYNEKNEYSILCKTNDKIISILILDENFNIVSNNKNYTSCIYHHSFDNYFVINTCDLIYLKGKKEYSLIASAYKTKYSIINETLGQCDTNISQINIDEDDKIDEKEEETENEIIEKEEEEKQNNNEKNNEYVKIQYYIENGLMKAETNMTKEVIVENLNLLLEDIEIGKIYKIEGDDYNIKISPVNNQSNNETYIDFSECENILRNSSDKYKNSTFTIMRIEIDNNNKQVLNNQVEYAVYDENKNKIDLSICKNIKIIYEIKNTSLLNTTFISQFSDKGIDVFNISDNFFNDICYSYSNNQTDLILGDRVEDIYQNFSLCDSNCEYMKINLTTMKVYCECQVKTEISTEVSEPQFSAVVKSTFKDSNINVIKCYKLVFNLSNKKSNIGFFVFVFFIICQIPLLVHFLIFGYKEMIDFISNEMIKNDYLEPKKKIESNPIYKNNNSSTKKIKKKNLSNTNNLKIQSNQKLIKDETSSKKLDILNAHLYENGYYKKTSKIIKMCKKPSERITNKIELKDSNNSRSSLEQKFPRRSKKSLSRKSKHSSISFIDKKEVRKCYEYGTLIRFHSSNIRLKKSLESKSILNNYTFKGAIKNDIRNFWRIFWINIINFELILHTFIFRTPLEFKSLRIVLFILSNATAFAFNALFYSNSKISDRYNYTGDYLYFYSLVNNLVISILSTIVSIFLLLLNKLINSRYELENIFRREEEKMMKNKSYVVSQQEKIIIKNQIDNVLKKLKIKIYIFLGIDISLMLFFLYFVTAFCAVYKDTQISWISDSITSFISAIVIELLISFFNSSLYTSALRYKIEILYDISIFIYKLR